MPQYQPGGAAPAPCFRRPLEGDTRNIQYFGFAKPPWLWGMDLSTLNSVHPAPHQVEKILAVSKGPKIQKEMFIPSAHKIICLSGSQICRLGTTDPGSVTQFHLANVAPRPRA